MFPGFDLPTGLLCIIHPGGNVTTYYPRREYELRIEGASETVVKYYFTTAGRTAMRVNGVLTWLVVDQVGSTTITANADGSFQSEIRYSAYGEVRYVNGTTITDKLYTGQQQETEIGLDYYVARFYDPAIAHFVQMDSLVPEAGSSNAYDRYGYGNNNPVRYNDPSGHDSIPIDDFIRQVILLVQNLGDTVIGNAICRRNIFTVIGLRR
jgi:RHS repeat-associated protein